MASMFDLRMIGDKEVERALGALPRELQTKTVRTALRKSGGRVKTELLLNLTGRILEEETGALVAAYEMQPVRTRRQPDGTVVASIKTPTQVQLGLPRPRHDPTIDVEHYGMIQEYGQPDQPPRPFMRKAVDDNVEREHRLIGQDVGAGTERAWRRLTRATR